MSWLCFLWLISLLSLQLLSLLRPCPTPPIGITPPFNSRDVVRHLRSIQRLHFLADILFASAIYPTAPFPPRNLVRHPRSIQRLYFLPKTSPNDAPDRPNGPTPFQWPCMTPAPSIQRLSFLLVTVSDTPPIDRTALFPSRDLVWRPFPTTRRLSFLPDVGALARDGGGPGLEQQWGGGGCARGRAERHSSGA